MNLDQKVFYAIYNLAGQSDFWDGVVFWANKISVPVFVFIMLWYLFRHRSIFWTVIIAVVLSRGIFTPLIRWFYFRARPFVALPDVRALASQNPAEAGFPSAHAVVFFAVAFAVFLFNRSAGIMLMVVALFLSLTRVYLGLHYPLDIVGGMVVAGVSVGLIFLWRKLKKV